MAAARALALAAARRRVSLAAHAPPLRGPTISPPLGARSALAPALLAPCASPPGAAARPALVRALIAPRAPPPVASAASALHVQRAPPPATTASALDPALQAQRAPPPTGAWHPGPAALLAPRALALLGVRAPCVHLLPVPARTRLAALGTHTKATVLPDETYGGRGKGKHAAGDANTDPVDGAHGKDDRNVAQAAAEDVRDGEKICDDAGGEVTSADGVGGANTNLVTSIHGMDDGNVVKAAVDVRSGGPGHTNLVDGNKTKHAGDHIMTRTDAVGASNTDLVAGVPGKGDGHVAKAAGDVRKDGAGRGCQCRCDCAANFNAFKTYADQNRQETVSQIKQMIEEHREDQLNHWVSNKNSRMTQTMVIGIITLTQLGIVAMAAVFFGAAVALEKAQDKMLVLSENEKMKTIVKNLLDLVREYLGEKTWTGVALVMNGVAMCGNGAAAVGHGAANKAAACWNALASVGHGAANKAAACWNALAFWKEKKEEKEEEKEEKKV